MTLIRASAWVDAEGRVKLPEDIRLATGLRAGQQVDIKVTGVGDTKSIVLAKRDYRRHLQPLR